ncbi:MAG: hypothetical protein ACE5SW_07140 [Nitrososphaeraceae archaeon]
MQKEKIDIPFSKYLKSTTCSKLIIHKSIEWSGKVSEKLVFIFYKPKKHNGFILRKIIPYVFSGFSIIFIGYLLLNIINDYPPKIIGIYP